MRASGDSDAPFFTTVLENIRARQSWNAKDSEIQKRRLAERPARKNNPYPGAPNFVDDIIDLNVSSRTDIEISMKLNAPSLVTAIPVGQVPPDVTARVQKAYDTQLRHIINYREKLEELIDTKNERGFGVSLALPLDDERFGMMGDFEIIDPKDAIPPVDLKTNDLPDVDGFTYVFRRTPRQLRDLERTGGWKNVTKLLGLLEEDEKGEGSTSARESNYDTEDYNSTKVTASIIGISTSDYKNGKVVNWCWMGYADKWIMQRAKNPDLKMGRKCMVYICPDYPDMILHSVAWKEKDIPAVTRPFTQAEYVMENIMALKQGREPATELVLSPAVEGKDKKWPIFQHRFEGRNRVWYASRGLGHLLMDNQIYSTGIRNAEAVWWDFAKHPLFQDDGTADVNQTNVKIKPGGKIPRGLTPAVMPQPPSALGFTSDREHRLAGARSGSANSMYSAQVSQTRKIEKTKAEIDSENAQQNLLSSASVDRINAPEARLLQAIWEMNREYRPALPMLDGDKFMGTIQATAQPGQKSDYDYEFIMVPAASAKSLNPDIQFAKNMALVRELFAPSSQMGVPFDARATAVYVGMGVNPDLTRIALPDPAQSQGGQMPINMQLQQIVQALGQMQQTLQGVVKAGVETDKRVDQVAKFALEHDDALGTTGGDVEGIKSVFDRAGIRIAGQNGNGNGRSRGRPVPGGVG